MRFIAAVALLAACQAAYGQSPAPPKVQMISAFNNFFGSVVGVQNSLLAPLAPFGRKLHSYDGGIVESIGNTNTNPLLRNGVVKGNAIGSIFYGVGFSTPGVLGEAFTGNDGTTGRKLLQDPYHLTSKANVVASLLKGYNPNLSPLFQQPTFSPPLYQQLTIQPIATQQVVAPVLPAQQSITFNTGSLITAQITADQQLQALAAQQVAADQAVQANIAAGVITNDQALQNQLIKDQVLQDQNIQAQIAAGQMSQDAAIQRQLAADQIAQNAAIQAQISSGQMTLNSAIQQQIAADQIAQNQAIQAQITSGQLSQSQAIQNQLAATQAAQDAQIQGQIATTTIQGRRLLQDNVAANYLGSAVVNNVNVLDLLLGNKQAQVQGVLPQYHARRMHQYIPGRTGYQQTGSLTVQENAVGSIVDKSASLTDPINDRKAILGFQQSQNKRHLLDLTSKTNADASLLSGNFGLDTIHKSIFGYNQAQN